MNLDFFDFVKRQYNMDFNDKQRAAIIQKEGPVLVLASPGSGYLNILVQK